MTTRISWALMVLAAGGLSACGSNAGQTNNNNSGLIPCEGIEDCPVGYVCVGNVCEPGTDAGVEPDASWDPDIEVDPATLDFGTPLLGVPVQQTLTITNVGGEDLTIFSILLEEDDAELEYSAQPLGNLGQILGPGDSMEVEVELTNLDAQADTGRLIINCDDLDEAMVQVPLISELKGDRVLGTCVMQSDELFTSCVNNPEVIDFGGLPGDASAVQDVSVWNNGTGNTPLVVTDIYVTNNSGYVGLFDLTFYELVPDPGSPGDFLEQELTDFPNLPYLLEVDDGVDGPEALLVRVQFTADANLEGRPVPSEFLVIQTDDASDPNHQIPFLGDVLCPAGWWEIDGLPPWCEYQCTITNGGVEDCDGVDNNCDAVIDEGCPVCGNGVVEAGETCDDGNQDNTDACPDGIFGSCEPAICGDGFVQAGVEQCDDGNQDNTDACTDDTGNGGQCENAHCGDGFVQAGVEGCDDGNHDNTDACPDGVFGTCLAAECGDGFLQAGVEECDDGQNNSDTVPDACRRTCEFPSCGDNVVDTGEVCDDGNTTGGDGCSADCLSSEVCGNGIVDPGETCDDGNQSNTDACPDGVMGSCQPAACGDLFIQTGVEECEPPNTATCDSSCQDISGPLTPAGCFMVFPAPSLYCAFGLVNFTFSCVQITVFGGTNITVTANSPTSQPCTMNGTIDAAGNFTATCSLLGGCDEHYTITGTYTDSDNWTATFVANYVGSCFGCVYTSWNLTGARTTCPCP